jgi:dTDP-glucose pyrophosphorylase
MTYCKLSDLSVGPESTIRQVMERINATLRSIALVLDGKGQLIDTITDGDIRRAMLAEMSLDSGVHELLSHKSNSKPVTASINSEPAYLLKLMQETSVHQLPLLDEAQIVRDLVTLEDLLPHDSSSLQAVIMAGGAGTRLRPLTEDLPKPMLPVGGRPLMELIVEGLRDAGIKRINVSTHYRTEKIVEHFGDGGRFGIELNYMTEVNPLGTAGALGLMKKPLDTMLVINGDILTEMDFRAMVNYHREHKAVLTVAVRKFDMNVPYGVIKAEGSMVKSLTEKPTISFFVNAGIYLLEPLAYSYIPHYKRFDMTDLIRCLLDAKQPVVSFPIHEYWLDIGHHTDYLQAQDDVVKRRKHA